MAYQCNVCRTSSTNDPIALHPYDLHMINTFSPQCAHHYTNFELKYPTIIHKREAIQCPQVNDTCGTTYVPQHIKMQAPIHAEGYQKPAQYYPQSAPRYVGPPVQRFTQNTPDRTVTPAQEQPTFASLIDKYVQAIGRDIRAMINV